MTYTRQGVRNLDGPQVNRRSRREEECFHEWYHPRDCIGCWGRNFGSNDDAPCEEYCRKCGLRKK